MHERFLTPRATRWALTLLILCATGGSAQTAFSLTTTIPLSSPENHQATFHNYSASSFYNTFDLLWAGLGREPELWTFINANARIACRGPRTSRTARST